MLFSNTSFVWDAVRNDNGHAIRARAGDLHAAVD